MEHLLELIVDLILEWTIVADTNDNVKMPRWARIGLLVLALIICVAFIVGLILLMMSEENTLFKVIMAGAVLFLVTTIISLWHRVMKARK